MEPAQWNGNVVVSDPLTHRKLHAPFHVLDPEGDMIIKIHDGTEDQLGNFKSSTIEQETNTETGNQCSKQQGEHCQNSLDAIDDPQGNLEHQKRCVPAIIYMKVSRAILCQVSLYFMALLGGNFAEGQLQFSKQNPPTLRFYEMNCKAALIVLLTIFMPQSLKTKGPISMELLVLVAKVADMWNCLHVFKSNIDQTGSFLDRALAMASKFNQQEKSVFFQDDLLDLADITELFGDKAFCSSLADFAISHTLTTDIWSVESSFVHLTRSREILQYWQDHAESTKIKIARKLLKAVQALTRTPFQMTDYQPTLLPYLRWLHDKSIPVILAVKDGERLGNQGITCCTYFRFLLPFLEVMDFTSDPPRCNASLSELKAIALEAGLQMGGPAFADHKTHSLCYRDARRRNRCLRDNRVIDFHELSQDLSNPNRFFCFSCFEDGVRNPGELHWKLRCPRGNHGRPATVQRYYELLGRHQIESMF